MTVRTTSPTVAAGPFVSVRPALCRRVAEFELFPTPVWLYPGLLGSATGAWCAVLDHRTLGYAWSTSVAVVAATLWTIVNALIRRRAASTFALVQLCSAVVSSASASLASSAARGRTRLRRPGSRTG